MDKDNESINKDYEVDDSEIKNRIEALLFAMNRYIQTDEISKYCDLTIRNTKKGINLLKKDLESRTSPVILIDADEGFKLSISPKYSEIVQKVVSQTELTKSMIETLAVIAWKNPILQSDVIRIRHTKAYEHLHDLEAKGFITRQSHGRSKILRLTNKFYEYFDVPKNNKNLKNLMPEEIISRIENTEKDLHHKLDEIEKYEEQEAKDKDEQQKIIEKRQDNSSLKGYHAIDEVNVMENHEELNQELTIEDNKEAIKSLEESSKEE